MNKLRPYLFWLIIAVVGVALMAAAVVLEPTATLSGAKGRSETVTVREAAKRLDQKFKDLESRARKAQATPEGNSYPTNDPAAFADLKANYFITRKWEQPLDNLRVGYSAQINEIRDQLLRRTLPLERPVKDNASSDSEWYFEYERQSTDLLSMLFDEALVQAGSSAVGQPAVRLNTMQPSTTLRREDLQTAREVRGTYGVFTKQASYPQRSLWPALSQRLRALEIICEIIRTSQAVPLENNQLAGLVPPPAPQRALLRGVQWKNGQISEAQTQAPQRNVIPGGELLELTLSLRGSPAVIQEITTAIERQESPLIAVVGSNWKTVQGQETSNPVDAPVDVDLHLAVLRFTAESLEALVAKPKEE